MRYLLDTNVLSEPAKAEPDGRVNRWIEAQPNLAVAISVLTLGEILKGVSLLPAGPKRSRLEKWLSTELPGQFMGRVIPVDQKAAIEWGVLAAAARSSGRPLSVIDGLLLATAATNELVFVTRNENECADRGVPILNPWSAGE